VCEGRGAGGVGGGGEGVGGEGWGGEGGGGGGGGVIVALMLIERAGDERSESRKWYLEVL